VYEKFKEVLFMKLEEGIPTLISLREFCTTTSKQKTYPVETVGGFYYWITKKGCPRKWPYSMWENELKEYSGRKV
jgi:hypothetical protein